jgi:exopolysaccharide biosynthesis protein
MSWDIVLFNSDEQITLVKELNPEKLVPTKFCEILENSSHLIVKDGNHRKIQGEDYSIEFYKSEEPESNTIVHLYGEKSFFEVIRLAKENNWQIYDTGIEEMINLENPQKSGYENHRKYVKHIMKK